MVTLGEPVQVGESAWRLDWTVVPPADVRVFQNGELVASGALTSYEFAVAPGDVLHVQVLDDPDEVPLPYFEERARLVWEVDAGVRAYRVEQYVSAAWVERQTLETLGEPWMEWYSERLADETVHQFRVVPIGVGGLESEPELFTFTMCRYPDRPNVDWSYDSGTGFVTIAAA